MDILLQTIVNGLAQGCVYALVALGFVLIYKATGVINLAQGDLMMAGAYLYLALTAFGELRAPLAFALAILLAALLGAMIERTLMRRLADEPEFIVLMATAGLAVVLRSAVGMSFSHETYRVPSLIEEHLYRLGGVTVAGEQVLTISVTVALSGLLFAFFRLTRFGIAMRAVADNRYAAHLMGVDVARMFTLTWAMAAAVAATGGILLANLSYLHTNMGVVGLRALPAAVLGGMTSVPGALVGGLIIGLVENLSGVYLDRYLGGGLKEVLAFAVLLVVLLLRPTGLFGLPDRKRV